ncbi:MAG: peptidylprolyl isomerase [Planctomycetaceae bacterium]|nr:MAG: peptidylprolyl isomerase [Planctomycetaceae bacterium]
MTQNNLATAGTAANKKSWKWMIAGTAVALLGAGAGIQFLRPTGAHSEDGAGKATAGKTAEAPRERLVATIKTGNSTDKVTYDELAKECVSRYGSEILDNLINRRIIQQACDQHGITVSEAEVKGEVNRIAKKFNLDEENWLRMLQSERNVTPAQYYNDIIWPMLALRKLAGESVEISEKEMQQAFVRNYGPRVKARAIVLDNPRRAREVHGKVMANPEDFGRFAREYSIDPNSRSLDGVIPPIPKYAGNDKLEEVAFKLKEGEISAVVQVGVSQFMILLCEGRTEQVVTERGEVEDLLREQLTEEKVQQSVAKVFEKMKEDARVENILTGSVQGGDKKGAAKKNAAVRPAGGTAGKSPAVTEASGEAESAATPAQKAARSAGKPRTIK